jgi:acetoin utilization deacetylase AcuC-like enzyme
MSVVVFTHPDCVRHDPGPGHPERPARLQAILERLAGWPGAEVRQAAPADRGALLVAHGEDHLDRLEAASHAGGGSLSLDTFVNSASWAAVLGATGAVFCLVNNVVVAARDAQRHGRERVLIVDWDVHHGNGTQALVERDETIRFVSLHQHPWYPGTGMAEERGVGNVFNVPRGPGAPPSRYVEDLWAAIVAATDEWAPELVLLSAGYDAMAGDPLGGFTLEPVHYAELTGRVRERLPDAPIVGLLEGGYIPARIAEGVAATVAALG